MFAVCSVSCKADSQSLLLALVCYHYTYSPPVWTWKRGGESLGLSSVWHRNTCVCKVCYIWQGRFTSSSLMFTDSRRFTLLDSHRPERYTKVFLALSMISSAAEGLNPLTPEKCLCTSWNWPLALTWAKFLLFCFLWARARNFLQKHSQAEFPSELGDKMHTQRKTSLRWTWEEGIGKSKLRSPAATAEMQEKKEDFGRAGLYSLVLWTSGNLESLVVESAIHGIVERESWDTQRTGRPLHHTYWSWKAVKYH